MILFDVNVLLNAHRPEQERHRVARELVESVVNQPAPFAVSELVLSAFVRIATDPRVFSVSTPLDEAYHVADGLVRRSNARIVRPGDRHWPIFEESLPAHSGARQPDRRRIPRRARAGARLRMDQLRSRLREVPRPALAPPARLSGAVAE